MHISWEILKIDYRRQIYFKKVLKNWDWNNQKQFLSNDSLLVLFGYWSEKVEIWLIANQKVTIPRHTPNHAFASSELLEIMENGRCSCITSPIMVFILFSSDLSCWKFYSFVHLPCTFGEAEWYWKGGLMLDPSAFISYGTLASDCREHKPQKYRK